MSNNNNNTPSTWTNLSWTVKLAMSVTSWGIKLSRRSDGSVNRRLMSFFDFKSPPSSINGVKTSDIIVDPSRNLWFRLYVPITTTTTTAATNDVNSSQLPVIVHFHGGGFTCICADSVGSDNLCRRLAKQLNAVIVSVNYRNSPEHKYPSQVEDGFDVLRYIELNPNFEGFPTDADLKNCFVSGDSAGGNLSHHVALKGSNYGFRNLRIVGVIALQPFFGGEERTESEIKLAGAPFITVKGTDWLWQAFLPEGADRDHPAANVFGPKSEDISGLNFPATIVIVGGYDPLLDWQKRYYEGLKKAGKEVYLIEYPNVFHSFYGVPDVPESALCINEVKKFMQKVVG